MQQEGAGVNLDTDEHINVDDTHRQTGGSSTATATTPLVPQSVAGQVSSSGHNLAFYKPFFVAGGLSELGGAALIILKYPDSDQTAEQMLTLFVAGVIAVAAGGLYKCFETPIDNAVKCVFGPCYDVCKGMIDASKAKPKQTAETSLLVEEGKGGEKREAERARK